MLSYNHFMTKQNGVDLEDNYILGSQAILTDCLCCVILGISLSVHTWALDFGSSYYMSHASIAKKKQNRFKIKLIDLLTHGWYYLVFKT